MAWRAVSSSDVEVARARARSIHESDTKKYYRDDEKHSHRRQSSLGTTFEDQDDYGEFSPRISKAPTRQVMHSKAFARRSRSSKIMVRVPPSMMRYVCLALFMMLIMFIMSLIKASWTSNRDVKIANAQGKLKAKPAPWEEFPFLSRYWGGIRSLVPYQDNTPEYPMIEDESMVQVGSSDRNKRSIPSSLVFDPYPNYASSEYTRRYGKKVDCFLDEEGKVDIPRVRMYKGRVNGFPEPVMGSAELLGLQHEICYERYGRLGPYGLGYGSEKGGSGRMLSGDVEAADLVWSKTPEVDFRDVSWKRVQDRCFEANSHRFNTTILPPSERFRTMHVGAHADRDDGFDNAFRIPRKSTRKPGETTVPRTAVVIRTWFDYPYTPEDLVYLRALMSELGLLSGGEYTLHFLIHVKDENLPIWSDDATYERVLSDALPKEFRGMGTLWSEKQMALMYPNLEETFMRDLPVHGVYRSTFMPMQYFAYQHPEFDFFWNWEMDVRNTGHWYHLFDSVSQWAKKQPRKYLWERNSRFYVPKEHGSWEDFSHTVRVQTEHGTNSPNNLWSGLRLGSDATPKSQAKLQGDKPIWGPERPQGDDVVFEGDVEAPTAMDNDKYEWGVGEDADLITFNPIFDPDSTTWLLAEDTTGYNKERGQPPRRTAIITASRLSRKLLLTMHRETAMRRHTMFSEMWPASCALHHGLKAVYAPHPEYIDRKWPLKYLEGVFNAGRNGATGASRNSVFGDREHNFRGTTWYYNAGFPEVLWHRWLGLPFNNDGGEEFELGGEGRMCLPGMLLHPIKRVNFPRLEDTLESTEIIDEAADPLPPPPAGGGGGGK